MSPARLLELRAELRAGLNESPRLARAVVDGLREMYPEVFSGLDVASLDRDMAAEVNVEGLVAFVDGLRAQLRATARLEAEEEIRAELRCERRDRRREQRARARARRVTS